MTPELTVRLDKGEAPFDGWTVASEELRLTPLRQAVSTVAARLRTTSPSGLSRFKDWFFHDECPSRESPFDWSEIDRKVESDEAATGFCVGDDLCSLAIFPADCTWLLRIFVPEEPGDPRYETCRFDLTGSLSLVQAITQDLAPLTLGFEPATRFFIPSWEREWKPDPSA